MTDLSTKAVDFDRIASRMADAMQRMLRTENFHGTDERRYAEALRRALGDAAAGEAGPYGRALDREHLWYGNGLMTEADAKHQFDNGALERMQLEQAEAQVKEMRAEVRRVYAEAAKDLADFLRAKCNERSVPSRYRREGVTWAADMLDPSVPKDRYGSLVAGAGEPR